MYKTAKTVKLGSIRACFSILLMPVYARLVVML